MSYLVNLKNANAELSRVGAELAAVSAERDAFKAALAERDAAAESVRTQFDATVADLTEKLSAANAQVASLTAAAQTAGQQAAEVVAAQGIDPASLPKATTPAQSAESLGAQIRAEADPQKRAALYVQLQTVWNSKN